MSRIGTRFQAFVFNTIRFFIKNAIVIFILFVLGVGIGYFFDSKEKFYNHELIVIPNFSSTDYLYSKVDLINSKINERDTLFLQSLGLKYPKNISKLKIEPIVDPYNFIRDSEENFDLIKLMSEDGSIDKVLKDRITSKNYMYHVITFSTKGKITKANTIDPLLSSFNNSSYYKIIQEKIIENVKQKMQYNEQTLGQINALLDRFSDNKGTNNVNLVYYNENTQIEEVLQTKNNLITEQGNRRLELVNYEKIVKDVSNITNIEKPSSSKIIFPFILVFIYVIGKLLFLFYRKNRAIFINND
ncbi:hypothetical protein ACI6PS_14080 [Flavobacterium sp. PLA-1-15]|uniref:hypothetical protein n=1 Tax=Flavobacterium sp. PLA-1-15 TaxID=3380533 RepID=UPI003B7900AA